MHLEKNVSENILTTLLGTSKKKEKMDLKLVVILKV